MPDSGNIKRFSVDDEFRAFYLANGFVVFKDLFSPYEIEEIYADILSLIRIRFGKDEPISAFVSGYSRDKATWKACAKQLQNSLPNLHVGTKPAIAATLKRAGLANPMACVLPEIRIDMPSDAQYRQPWHQDWRSGQGSLNSVTVWVPLHDVTAEHGAIDFIPGSHLLGYQPTDVIVEPMRFLMRDPPSDRARRVTATLRRGECVLFSQFLIHQSGTNNSGVPRFTSQFRFADRSDPAFIANNYRIPTSSELVWDSPPSAKEVSKVFE